MIPFSFDAGRVLRPSLVRRTGAHRIDIATEENL
jgi:hypothetical protein